MKSFVLLFASFAATVAIINATCLYCGSNKTDRQEIKYEDLKYPEDFYAGDQYSYEPKNIGEKCRFVLKAVENYPLYVEKAKETLKFSDPLNVIDSTELMANGDIQYRNAILHGLEHSYLNEVNFNEIDKNLFSVSATLKTAEITGDYVAANSYKKESGHFYITLKDVEFKTKFFFDQFLEIEPEIAAESITFGHHESVYTNEDVLKDLEDESPKMAKPYSYYYTYLNQVIKSHIANEMFASFTPLIAKRFEQLLGPAVLFPTKGFELPNFNMNIAPGVQATISNAFLQDMKNTNKMQKLMNYTYGADDSVEMLFTFTAFDLRGHTSWALNYYNSGNAYTGRAVFAVDNLQTVIVASKPNNKQANVSVKFAKTTVNGLEIILSDDDNSESIRYFAHERLPEVLESSLKTFINDQSETVLKNQFALIGEKSQY